MQSGTLLSSDPTPLSAIWASRIAIFSAGVLVTGLVLHRLVSLPTPVALNIVKLSIFGGIVALILCMVAVSTIWRTGANGTALIVITSLIGGALVAWPLVQLPTIRKLPEINDVTTDFDNPPSFKALAQKRPTDANQIEYPGATFAEKQREAYPDLQSLWVNRSSAESFEIARDALKRQGLEIVEAVPPGSGTGRPGRIEAVDSTLVLGFKDDVAVRVIGNAASSRIDLRSASRYGRHDMGQNAERIRRILKELNARLEATVATERNS